MVIFTPISIVYESSVFVRPTHVRRNVMKKPNPELIDDEIPELDEEWFKTHSPA